MKQDVVVITGMHRSGTSLVASVLQKTGVNIGENLLGPDRGNNRGHFEDVDFFDFHDRVLRRFEQTLLVQDLACLGEMSPTETERALALIQRRQNQSIWGWKDPRTTLFLDFWHKLLPQARYIFVYRHPLEVIFSLLRRGTDLEALTNPLASLRSWQAYNQSLLNFHQQHREICLLGHIKTITADIQTFVQQVGRKLALPLKGEDLQALYHSSELKEIAFPSATTPILERLAPGIMSLYHQLEAEADLPDQALEPAVMAPTPQLVELQEIALTLETGETLAEDQRIHLLNELLFVLDARAVLAGKKALDEIRLNHIGQLQNQIDEIRPHVRQLRQQLREIESTRSWQLVLKWFAFKEHLKRLSQFDIGSPRIGLPHKIPAPLKIGQEAAVNGRNRPSLTSQPILFISHHAGRTGAPIILLNFLKWLKTNRDLPFEILLLKDGELRSEFEALGPTIIWDSTLYGDQRQAYIEQIISSLKEAGIRLIYANTITVGDVLAALSKLNCPIITHVHELEYWINHRVDPKSLKQIQKHTWRYIAVSQAVKQNLIDNLKIPAEKISLIYEFTPTQPDFKGVQVQRIRKRLRIPDDALIIGGSGTTDWRKGPDLFIQLARAVQQRFLEKPVHFVWVGGETGGPNFAALWYDVKRAGLDQFIHFVGACTNPLDYFAAFDMFALVSREDPFPVVNLEVASLGKPILCFDKSGGAKEFVGEECGFVVPYLDIEAMAARAVELLRTPELRQQMGQRAAQKVCQEHDIAVVAPQILTCIEQLLERQ